MVSDVRRRWRKAKFKKRMKDYFTDKPKSDFWMWAFITLFLFQYVTPFALMMYVPLQIGLLSPETIVDYDEISDKVAKTLIEPMERINKIGSNLAVDRPILSKVLFYAFSSLVWVWWVAIFFLMINISRYGISFIVRNIKLRSKDGKD